MPACNPAFAFVAVTIECRLCCDQLEFTFDTSSYHTFDRGFKEAVVDLAQQNDWKVITVKDDYYDLSLDDYKTSHYHDFVCGRCRRKNKKA